MKPIITILICLLYISTAIAQKKTFVRVFNHDGKKTNKGFLMQANDSTMQIMQNGKTIDIPINKMERIKLRRSFGHTIFISMLVTGTAVGVLGAAGADPDDFLGYTATEGFIAGFVIGTVAGVVPGGIIGGTRNRPEFLIEGKQENWQIVKKALKQFLPTNEDKALAQQ